MTNIIKKSLTLFTISVLLAFCLVLSGCDNEEDIRDAKLSQIYPASLLIKDLKPITLISPNNGETYYIDDRAANDLVFRFDGDKSYFTSVIIFKNQPNVSKDGHIVDGNSQCLGGVTNMSSLHPWNGFSSVFSVDQNKSVIYTCNSDATTDIFSETNKLALDETTFPKGAEIYWAVLGYSDRYSLTHSSPIRKINIQ